MRSHSSPLVGFVLCVLLGGFSGVSAQSPGRKHVSDPAAQALNDLLNAAQSAIDKQDYPGAVQNYQDYLAKKPDDAIVHYDLGYAYSALNRPGDAKPEYERAIALDPKMGAAYLNLGLTTARYRSIGRCQLSRKSRRTIPARCANEMGARHGARKIWQTPRSHRAIPGRANTRRHGFQDPTLPWPRLSDRRPGGRRRSRVSGGAYTARFEP